MPVDVHVRPFFDSSVPVAIQTMKASAGRLYFIEAQNINAADGFIQLFDKLAADVTVGTTVPNLSFLVPKGDATSKGAFTMEFNPPVNFEFGIAYCGATTMTGNGEPSVALVLNAGYT